MNRATTQFWVAVIGISGLTVITGLSLVTGEGPTDILVGGIISVTSMAAAWLFRLNGAAK